MARHFKIHQLLSRDELDALEAFTREPGRTIDEVNTWLEAHGCVIGGKGTVSRGAIHEWRKAFLVEDKMFQAAKLSKAVMEAMEDKDLVSLADASAAQLGQIIYERTVEMLIDGTASPADIVNMTNAAGNLLKGKRLIETLRDEMREKFDQQIAGAKKRPDGLISAEDIAKAKEAIFGK